MILSISKMILAILCVLLPRHVNTDFSEIENHVKFISINVGLLVGGYNEKMSEKELQEKMEFVIIGDLK
jgi:hypothetical protein